MVLSKKAQYALVGLMMAIVVIIFVFQFITPIKDEVIIARNATNLDCTNTSTDISTGQRMTCIAVDLYLPWYVILGIAMAGAYLIGRRVEFKFSPPQQ